MNLLIYGERERARRGYRKSRKLSVWPSIAPTFRQLASKLSTARRGLGECWSISSWGFMERMLWKMFTGKRKLVQISTFFNPVFEWSYALLHWLVECPNSTFSATKSMSSYSSEIDLNYSQLAGFDWRATTQCKLPLQIITCSNGYGYFDTFWWNDHRIEILNFFKINSHFFYWLNPSK